MTITEFLTARLDEDEAETWVIVPYDCAPGCCAPEGWVGHQCQWCDSMPVYGGTRDAIVEIAQEHAETVHQRSRVLAEVEAKRAIVALHAPKDRRPWGIGNGWQECVVCFDPSTEAGEYTWETWPCPTLRALVQSYADHPDCDEAWRA